jgi:hypothetical protein
MTKAGGRCARGREDCRRFAPRGPCTFPSEDREIASVPVSPASTPPTELDCVATIQAARNAEGVRQSPKYSRQQKKDRDFSRPLASKRNSNQYNRKVTSTLICTATGLPSFIAGSNFQVFTASIAFSSSPRPSVRATRMSRARPSGPTTNHSTHVP